MKIRVMSVLAVLCLLWVCYPASEVAYSSPQNTVNQWLIEFRPTDSKLQLTLRYSRGGGSGFHNTGFAIELEKLTGLTREQLMSPMGTNVRFQLKRDAGTFDFEGWFKQGNGSGHFIFTGNSSFNSELSRLGFGRASEEQLLSLAMSDAGLAFINELKAQDYDTNTVEQLVRMANHGVRLEYLQGLKSLGYTVKSTDLVVRMKDHGVSLNFIKELSALGYTNLTPEELVRTRDHGVSASFITEIKDLGYTNTSVEQLVRLKDHGVTAAYIKRMKERGYGDLTLDEYIRLRDRGERE